MKKIILCILGFIPLLGMSQLIMTQTPTGVSTANTDWYRGGNTASPNTNNIFGTFWNSEVHHYTNGLRRFTTTTNNGLSNAAFNSSIGLVGDGISINTNGTNSGPFASIDLFTSSSNTTCIRMGRGFLMQTANSRTEHIGNYNGFWYNVTNVYPGFTPQYIWNINQAEQGRLANTGRWRFGPNPTNLAPANRVEIKSAITDPYFPNASGLRLANLTSAGAIVPNGVNGVNSNKLLTVDANGDVVLTAPTGGITANNGLQINSSGTVQLGGLCSSTTEVFNSRLQSDRKIWMRGFNLLFENPSSPNSLALGRIGIGDFTGCTNPQNLVEISKNTSTPNSFGLSGLRLTDLRLGAGVNPPNGQALSVDANGDVILVNAAGGGGINFCTTFPPPANNVVKATATPNEVCQTNITDLHPLGSVGINNTAPNDALDVSPGIGTSGDIDVTNNTSAYQINDKDILWHKGIVNNLYVGVTAGAATPTGPGAGTDNTIIGFGAASGLPLGVFDNKNTIIGSEAGSAFTFGTGSNTYVGYRTGRTADGVNNSYFGCQAGENNAPGADENTFVGWHTGRNNAGLHNVFVGNLSGQNNTGFQNTFVGIGSGQNAGGAFNVSIGGGSGPVGPGLSNSISIGNGVNAQNSNQMLLGDNAINVGIGLNTDVPGPQTKLEIDAGINGTNPSPAGPGASGLRFRDLKSNASTVPNPGPGVLSVNTFGDVIYVPSSSSSGGGVGNYCTATPNPLTGNFSVPLNNNNYDFLDDASYTDKVNVGNTACSIPAGKLNATTAFPTLLGTINSITVHATNYNALTGSTNTGVYGEVTSAGISTDAFGVWGNAATSTRRNYGVYGTGGSAPAMSHGGFFESKMANQTNIGVHGEAQNANTINVGVEGLATGCQYARGGDFSAYSFSCNLENIGVSGHAFPFSSSSIPTYPSSVNIGVYGQVPTVLPPAISGDYAGFFDGNVWVNGPASGTGYLITSDRRFKTEITNLTNGLDIIKQLKPRNYLYDTKNKYGMRFDSRKQYGFIAQELEQVLPELITETHKPAMLDKEFKTVTEAVDFKAVNYDGLIAVLVKSVQELEEQNAKQTQLIEELTQKVNGLSNPSVIGKQETTLSTGNVIVLDQNVPNPFTDKTVISYNIPQHAGSCYIHFYANDGKLIQQTLLTQKGRGEITVYANNLSSGNYTYSLVIDGRVIESKKMTVR